ncbi:MAG: hypothetical protein EBR83_02835 [Verrucomicrobia bacterium]|nr:hypothetical protein [Verrucomicrobiota bacterium]
MIIDPTNTTALISLKPSAFRELSSEILTASVPHLHAAHKAAMTAACTARDSGRSSSIETSALFEIAWKIAERAEIAERLPKKRLEAAAKADRAKAKASKAKAEMDLVILLKPAVTLIRATLADAEKQIAERIAQRYLRDFDYLVALAAKAISEGTTRRRKNADGSIEVVKTETTISDFYDLVGDQQRQMPAYRLLFSDDSCPSFRDPLAKRTIRDRAVAAKRLGKVAADEADAFVGGFAWKIASRTAERHYAHTGMTDSTIVAATSNGAVWEGSTIHISATNPSASNPMTYTFETKCIINFSKYGKAFNQWPTREVAAVGERLTPSEA